MKIEIKNIDGIIYEPEPGKFYLYSQNKEGFSCEPEIPASLMQEHDWTAPKKVTVNVTVEIT